MRFYPAIDLKDGDCVRLLKGDMNAATVFNTDPGAQAAAFEAVGAEWVHVVDLNGAVEGRAVNRAAVESIISRVTIPVQLGGGIRSMEAIDAWLAAGVRRVVLGTVALRDPDLVKAACARHPGRIAVGIDARGGRVAVEGWVQTSETTAEDLALRFEDSGVAAIIYTDIDRDGTLTGVNAEATAALARRTETPVIASGGVSGPGDLRALMALEASGIEGVICGRSLYDGRLDPASAVAILAGRAPQ
ncbi:1-(5-phosphoribosyl)-5-[(5-phosphoribosylamino)methylideneamino]imidazole-4-carboxamide isomerase [Fodinicurvata sp. EGI_FJ10296]|uniref:1-(5-phosphoribosyl)-5-[(5- phosphoribosylamino)methylideneamino]imidazole-4- carboxamide isomerase n=1 Tax=Fodinicurvata sp. EGI_FJ10296 TaxID=3231908 RepID=UPI003454A02A